MSFCFIWDIESRTIYKVYEVTVSRYEILYILYNMYCEVVSVLDMSYQEHAFCPRVCLDQWTGQGTRQEPSRSTNTL